MGINSLINKGSSGGEVEYESFFRYWYGIELSTPNTWDTLYEETRPGYIDLFSLFIERNNQPKEFKITIDGVQTFYATQVSTTQQCWITLGNTSTHSFNNPRNDGFALPSVLDNESRMLNGQMNFTKASSAVIYPLIYNNEAGYKEANAYNTIIYTPIQNRLSDVCIPLTNNLNFKSIKIEVKYGINVGGVYEQRHRMYISGGIKK